MSTTKKQTVCHLPPDLTKRMDRLARRNERSRAAEIRIAVRAHLARHGVKE